MIRRDVQGDGDVRAKVSDCFELKARKLANRPGFTRRAFRQSYQSRPDITADLRFDACIFQNFAN